MIKEYKIKEFKNKICNFKYAKCKECIFNTGIKCHGHGDYFAICIILEKLLSKNESIIEKYNKENNLNIKIDCWYSLVNDESDCKLYKLINKFNEQDKIKL